MSHIALVGPMGVGKTTVGRALSERLNTLFVDLDERIEAIAKESIKDIFHNCGEDGFRRFELEALEQLESEQTYDRWVVATGGGVVVTPKCRQILLERFEVVFLNADVSTLLIHLNEDTTHRPLLQTAGSALQRIQGLLHTRMPLYREVADVEISVDHRSPDEVVDSILNWLK